jgi:uncharacterized membrane protein YphA (DoxX/SURF4 family)
MKYLKSGALWLITLLMAVVMVGPGSQKFTGATWERMFRAWGYPDGFYLVIGAIEVVAGAGLLIPKLASYSGIVLAIVMIGAAATQVLRGGRDGVGEIVFAVLISVIAFVRWPDRLRIRANSPVAAS